MPNQHRPTPKSQKKKRRRRAAKLAIAARWKRPVSPLTPAPSSSASISTSISLPSAPPSMVGARVMDLKRLSEGITTVSEHGKQCEGNCFISGEVRRDGLASVLEVSCDGCDEKLAIESSDKIVGSKGMNTRYSVNVGAVWGQMATGGGQRNLNEFMASINAPGMSKPTFNHIETQIGKKWGEILSDEIIKAGEEEKNLAVERKDFFQGVPSITVVIDGGWSKRSHKHSYRQGNEQTIIFRSS